MANEGAGMADAPRIRWDRLGRVALLLFIPALLFLYVGPARSYWDTWHEARDRREQIADLKQEQRNLRARKAALTDPTALEREARRLGMVRFGERAYVVKGLPDG